MGYNLNCLKCGKPYYAFPYNVYDRKYCSQDCSNKANAMKLSQDRIGQGNPMFGVRPWNYIKGGQRNINYQYNNNWKESKLIWSNITPLMK